MLDNGLEIGMSNREKLTEVFTRYKEWSLEDQRLAVRFCRSRPAYEKGHTKIIVALNHWDEEPNESLEVFGEDPWPEGPPDFMEFGTGPG